MKKLMSVLAAVFFSAAILAAEPFFVYDADCLAKRNLELGIQSYYGVDEWTVAGVTNSKDYKVTLLSAAMPLKYGATDKLQLNLKVPYVSWKYTETGAAGTSEAGLGQVSAGFKYALCKKCAFVFDAQTPTGDEDKALGEGTDYGVYIAKTGKLKSLAVSGNAGYILKSEYKENGVKINPADPIVLGAAVEYSLAKLTLIGEARGQLFGKTKIAGTSVDDSNGSTLDLILGGQYAADALKLKLGFGFAAGSDDYRAGLFRFNDSWDWKIVLAGSYRFKI